MSGRIEDGAPPFIALCGNPNVGKSTVFNALTGLKQHTGNWTGKTVETAMGRYEYGGWSYRIADLPGCYSLDAASPEEAAARDLLESGAADCAVIVCDAACLERSLMLSLQILRLGLNAVLCLNFMSAAKKQGIHIDVEGLSEMLGVEVAALSRVSSDELDGLKAAIERAVKRGRDGIIPPCAARGCAGCRLCGADELWKRAAGIAEKAIKRDGDTVSARRLKLDRLLTGRVTGRLAVLLLIGLVLYLTIAGSNYPSQWLEYGLGRLLELIRGGMEAVGLPEKLTDAVCGGMLDTLFTVISVMLPPMAIFFPLFTLLEDAGLLPRFAFCIDKRFAKCGSCGRQALTMAMGLGCNAVGVTGCRIIGDKRERLAAILTNSLTPCNGRFPALIALTAALGAAVGVGSGGMFSALMLTFWLLLALIVTLGATRLLTLTLLRGGKSGFILELPPYRKPRFGQVIVRSLIDRTAKILLRAVAVAAPAGLVIWLMSEAGWLSPAAGFLEPVGRLMGLNGAILLGFLLGLPANELILPLIIMIGSGAAGAEVSLGISAIASAGGRPAVTLICMTALMLFHSPCATTLLTVRHETRSLGWTLIAFALPSAIGVLLCIAINAVGML